MKKIEEYTKEELRELKQPEIETLIDLECAHKGIPLLPDPPEKPVVDKPKEDLTVFHIPDVYIKSQQDAVEIIDLINSRVRVKEKWYKDGYKEDVEQLVFSVEKVFSTEMENKTAAVQETVRQIEAQYNELKKEYDEIVKKRKDVILEVNNKINEALKEQKKIEKYKSLYARYLKLAEGEKDIAMNFLKASTSESEHVFIDEILLPEVIQDIMLGIKHSPTIGLVKIGETEIGKLMN